ncbi:MAG: type III-A CRISPR-associated RAMP protein Csm3 [bacterium]
MKQKKIKRIAGNIKIITGLHVGAGSDTIEIGGMDNPIIRNPVTNEPYIPGSSVKGKMRSLMEWESGKLMNNKGKHCNCGECKICRVFGSSAANRNDREKALRRGPTRLIVRDAQLSKASREKNINEGIPLVEEKHENSINRITAAATPRPIERVVPGTVFDFELSYRVIDTGDGDNGSEDEDNFEKVVLKSLALLQVDYLGGGGSRGNGRIQFENLQDENGNPIELPEV